MKSSLFEFPEVVVVEASAGSGKTYALAKRYVQLALSLSQQQDLPIQSILAITFTNKATLEMKSRILDFLKRMALKQLKPYEFDDMVRPLGIDENQAARLAFALMDQVIRQYHYFQVQTIDSFINALLSGCSFKIGLSARFKIQRNSKEYLQLALDELLETAHKDKAIFRLFDDFLHQYLFMENRTGWFPRKDLLKVMSALFSQYNTYQKSLLAYPLDEDLLAKKRKIYGLIEQLKELSPPQTKKVFAAHLTNFLEKYAGGFDVDALSSSSWENDEFPVNKGGVVSNELADLWQLIRKEVHDLCWLESRSMFNAYILLFEALLTDFYQLSKRDDILFLEELNRKAASLFDDGLVTANELYFRLASRFKHYLMDEFQDTSLAQWRNLSLMVEEALSTDGSLFYVGDKKQAIYGWRGGESRLFDALQGQLAASVKLETLDKNYRSHANIIGFNNRIFDLENLHGFLERKFEDEREHKREGVNFADEDFEQIANVFKHSHQLPGKDLAGGLVDVSLLSGRTKEERNAEAQKRLIALVQELSKRFALNDIAILTRGNEELEEITQWLLQAGIHAQSERNSDIKNNFLVNELIAFLSFLYSPIDNNAFAQFCLGELLPQASGLTPEVLRKFLFDCARQQEKEREPYYYQRFRAAFPQVWDNLFEPFVRQVGVFPLYELTAGIIARMGCEKHFPQYQGFVIHLLQLIKAQEEQSCDLGAFLEYFLEVEGAECFVPMAEALAVKILTVHKSKGLEFQAVIIPFLEMEVKVGSGGRDGSQAYMLDIQEEGMSLIRLKESYRRFCSPLQARYEEEYKRAVLVELNTVYVALTRAIEELHVFVPERSGNSVNLARFLFPEECITIGEPAQRACVHKQVQEHRKIVTFIDDQWFPELREEFLSDEPVSAAAARDGEAYHTLLMSVGNLTGADHEEVFLKAWQKVSGRHGFSITQEEAKARFQLIVDAPGVRPFFNLPPEAELYCEKEFVNRFGDAKRIDRLIVYPDRVQVIDYKTSRQAQDQHRLQMNGYLELMKGFYPRRTVEGFLIYLDTLDVYKI